MSAGKPRLLDMAFWLLSLRYRPERRDEWSPMLIDSHGMQTDLDMIAEACVVEAEGHEREVSRQRGETESRRNSV